MTERPLKKRRLSESVSDGDAIDCDVKVDSDEC